MAQPNNEPAATIVDLGAILEIQEKTAVEIGVILEIQEKGDVETGVVLEMQGKPMGEDEPGGEKKDDVAKVCLELDGKMTIIPSIA